MLLLYADMLACYCQDATMFFFSRYALRAFATRHEILPSSRLFSLYDMRILSAFVYAAERDAVFALMMPPR